MREELKGSERRIFRFLLTEWDRDTIEWPRVESTQGLEIRPAEIEATLRSLERKGYVEEFNQGHWRVTPRGLGVQKSLLGTPMSTASVRR